MEVILLGIYSFFVWLIFFKFKWLPWNIVSQVTVAIIPIVGLTVLILTLNVVAPSSSDVRVFKFTIPIVSQVRGRVIEVPVVEGNVLVRKGDVLFRVDPTPYQLDVNTLVAQLANTEAAQRELEESAKGAQAKVAETRAAIAQAVSRTREVSARLALARKRVDQYTELVGTGAGNRFDLERTFNQARSELLDGFLAADGFETLIEDLVNRRRACRRFRFGFGRVGFRSVRFRFILRCDGDGREQRES